MKKIKTIILGGGLAGLTAGMELERRGYHDFMVLEKESEPCGLLKTSMSSGIPIDVLPHVFFSSNEAVRKLYFDLIPDNQRQDSRLGVCVGGNYIDYPFQLNVYQLPEELRQKCLEGYLNNLHENDLRSLSEISNLEQFFRCQFGKEMTELFFRPYNEKLWCTKMKELSVDWTSHKIDKIDFKLMSQSFLGFPQGKKPSFGAHAEFFYPKNGGIQSLADNIYKRIDKQRVMLLELVEEIDVSKKIITTNKNQWQYENCIWTFPLSTFGQYTGIDLKQSEKLDYTTVLSLHVLANNVNLPKYHWIYFGDAEISIYRITRVDQINSSHQYQEVPLIIEVSHKGQNSFDVTLAINTVKKDLMRLKIIKDESDLIFMEDSQSTPGYVIEDHQCKENTKHIHEDMDEMSIIPAGRFGEWKFFNMDHTMQSAIDAVEKLLNKHE